MACPHLPADLSAALAALSARLPRQTRAPTPPCSISEPESEAPAPPPDAAPCSGCAGKVGPARWICLDCGDINCGRSLHFHAEAHHTATTHAVSLCLSTKATHCYSCDSFSTYGSRETDLEPLRRAIDAVAAGAAADGRSALDDDAGENAMDVEARVPTPPAEPEPRVPSRPGKRATSARKFPTITGLSNLGNTCFMNVVLQTLCHTSPFKAYYLRDVETVPSLSEGSPTPPPASPRSSPRIAAASKRAAVGDVKDISIWSEFCRLLRDMWTGSAVTVSPTAFFDAVWAIVPMFRGYQEQDAQEFIRYLLDRIHHELHDEPIRNSIENVFQGLLRNVVRCLKCGYVSTKTDPFLDLSLPIPEGFVKRTNMVLQRMHPCTVNDCLKAFTEVEEMADSEKSPGKISARLKEPLRAIAEQLGEKKLHFCLQPSGPREKIAWEGVTQHSS
ncbi:hypothetical protein BDK51DRAFT_26961 [Blyttiomyces helicus]|uniref:Uncharacterized protein n=1 Tax=Blyttiomyces helicus TaxID=388810 RepID=A0A4P9WHD0_9FUNG|nr:hypothetical protein BDK51DRAFT_26961 [Blyttiomyces helicus]|eukprot:RKO89936.1 hypothetical protein BDK51DRAFT_26961 [Blyttiomyces helicus]